MNIIDTFVQEAEAFLDAIVREITALFGSSNPLGVAIVDLAKQLKADMEQITVVTTAGTSTLVATEKVWQEVLSFVKTVKDGVKAGPMAANWKDEVKKVLDLGIPVVLSSLAPGTSAPLVLLSETVVDKLLALL